MSAFSTACFLALVDHHGEGWGHCHPSYLVEKDYVINSDPETAYAALDRTNQLRVLSYCKAWKLDLPEVVQKYESETWGNV